MMPGSDLLVAAVQLTSTRDVDSNLQRAADWTRRAAEAGASFVVLPENFGFLGGDAELLPHAQPVEGGAFTAPLRALAKERGIHVLAGSIPEQGPDAQHVYATSVLIGPAGQTLATYRKIHLFDVQMGEARHRESQQIAPGDTPVVGCVGKHGDWPVGLSICYDVRFPELYRQLVRQGARVLTVPAAFTLHTGKDHWEPLLRARAIENQCYVVAAGQFGRHSDKRATWGKSMIVDPWGTVLACAPEREGFVLASCDAEAQAQTRVELPCLANRRLQ